MLHVCHAHACTIQVPAKMFMCKAHWFALRRLMQRAIWREYREGQEIDKNPSLRYLAVQQQAIGELAAEPHKTAYKAEAADFRRLAISEGGGDPLAGLVT